MNSLNCKIASAAKQGMGSHEGTKGTKITMKGRSPFVAIVLFVASCEIFWIAASPWIRSGARRNDGFANRTTAPLRRRIHG